MDFADGKTDFLLLNKGNPDTDTDAVMAVADLDGAKALCLTASNGNTLRVGINTTGLLGDRAADLRTVVLDVYAEYPDGNFKAVEGSLTAYDSAMNALADNVWTVYMATRNPNQAKLTLEADLPVSILEFTRTIDGAYDNGDTPAVIYIKSMAFYDADNKAIPVDTSAGWTGPEGYGEAPPSITATPDPTVFVDEGGGKRRFPIAHLIGPYSVVTVVYTPAENSGALEVIVKDPENGYWAQNAVNEIIEDGAQRRAVITAESIEKKFPGALTRASETSERGVVLTNWNAGTTIDEIIIENAAGLIINVKDITDEGGGKFRYAIADKIAPYSELRILYTPAVYAGGDNLELIVKDPDNGYWLQNAADDILEFGNGKQYLAVFKADTIEQNAPGAFERAGGTDEKGIIITNWSPDTVIDEILIVNPLG